MEVDSNNEQEERNQKLSMGENNAKEIQPTQGDAMKTPVLVR